MTIPTALSWFPSLVADVFALALALALAVEAEALAEERDALALLALIALLLAADPEADAAKLYQHNSIFRTYRRQWNWPN